VVIAEELRLKKFREEGLKELKTRSVNRFQETDIGISEQ
jgi:hypothetical protein